MVKMKCRNDEEGVERREMDRYKRTGESNTEAEKKRRCRVTGTGKKGKVRVTVWLDTI